MNEGQRLGPYEVEKKLGAGGMGEVYLAQDTRLGRKVAIKVLPAQFAGDPERLARFEQESRAAAALNHPGIAAIYDVGVDGDGADRTHYMVQEFLEGETLQELLDRGPVARKKALTLAAEIAAALAVAHEAGIIHRDLKPANVFVTPGGNAKVLDFGLAKLTEMSAVSASGDNSMSPTVVGTMTGTIMGTAGYMAPEQVHGENVDRRADIFALGCVLYELLGGQRAFSGKSLPDTLARILHEEPEPLTGLGLELDRLVAKCLAKEPGERYQHADDLAVDLRHLATRDADVAAAVGMDAAANEASGVGWMMVAGGATIALFAGVFGATWWAGTGGAASSGPANDAAMPVQITEFSTTVEEPAISPNGQMVAFIATDPTEGWGQVYVKTLPDGPPLRLTDTPDHKATPSFSPDGSRVAYTVVGEDWKWDTWSVSINGDTPRLMLRNGNSLRWTPDGRVIFSQYKEGAHLGIVRADESGANQEEVWFPPQTYQMAHYSDVSPDGELVAIGYMGASEGNSRQCFVSTFPVPEGEPEPIADGGCRQRIHFSVDGRWVYYLGGAGDEIWRIPVAGGPAEQIVRRYPGMEDMSGFSLSPDGRQLIYSAGSARRNVWLRRSDGSTAQLTFENDASDPVFSVDGRFVVYRQAARSSTGSLWRYRLADGTREQVCPGLDAGAFLLAPDGNRLAVLVRGADGLGDLMMCHADGSEPPRRIVSGVNRFGGTPVFAPDGSTLYLGARGESGRPGLLAIDVETGAMELLRDFDVPATVTDVSPDGRWLAVRHGFAESNGWLYPIEGDDEPRLIVDGWEFEWSPDGSSFLFLNDGMVSSAWELANPEGLLVPASVPEDVTVDWLREAGAVRLFSAMGFSRASPSPRLYEAVFDMTEQRGNLYSITLPE